jgi:hypothetical protein
MEIYSGTPDPVFRNSQQPAKYHRNPFPDPGQEYRNPPQPEKYDGNLFWDPGSGVPEFTTACKIP